MNKKEKSQKMKQVRLSIDLIDSKILPLMVKRSHLVSKALDLKTKRSEIVDLKRINQIIFLTGAYALGSPIYQLGRSYYNSHYGLKNDERINNLYNTTKS